MANLLYPLLQLSDSNFPSGAFSHSFGLETYIQEGVITDKESFAKAINVYIRKQLVFIDGLACKLAYDALLREDLAEVVELDERLYVSSLAEETRLGNRRIGERMAKLCMDLYPSNYLEEYFKLIQQKKAYGHSAIVFALVAHDLGVPKEACVQTYLFSTMSSIVQNAVRGIPLGQTDGQRILVEVQPHLESAVHSIYELSKNDFAAVSPGLEIAQMRHERLHVRLFMS
ncbi:urease accessory protein UreF [Bacillus sp. AK128]